mmetsp:Transcript_26097/g.66261  ORF Transcript_26097/g.66261 Transcript_26097/m.66261 type:complete len:204 (+) Transcript_26097:441-1052(+)
MAAAAGAPRLLSRRRRAPLRCGALLGLPRFPTLSTNLLPLVLRERRASLSAGLRGHRLRLDRGRLLRLLGWRHDRIGGVFDQAIGDSNLDLSELLLRQHLSLLPLLLPLLLGLERAGRLRRRHLERIGCLSERRRRHRRAVDRRRGWWRSGWLLRRLLRRLGGRWRRLGGRRHLRRWSGCGRCGGHQRTRLGRPSLLEQHLVL